MSSRAELSPVDPANPPLAVIFGLRGRTLDPAQAAFFKRANPLGFILFGDNALNGQNGNIADPAQVKGLIHDLKTQMGRDVPVLIDQEGGRVARLRPPHWPAWPAAGTIGALAAQDLSAARVESARVSGSIAGELAALGVHVNCAPVLDIAFPKTHAVIGDRAFSDDPSVVADLGVAACRAFLRAGVIPVVKHLPGHGRATADSHAALPVVAASLAALDGADLVPYYALLKEKFAKAVWGMVAHVVYSDSDPARPASCSPAVIGMIRNRLGFDGFLLSDDIVMGALSGLGTMAGRAEKSLDAGCDAVLHCNGAMDEMEEIAATRRIMTPEAVRRFNESLKGMCLA